MTIFPIIKIICLNFFNYLRDQTSKTVRQLWVQRLNVLMQLFGNGFFITCRGRCSLVHHIIIIFKFVFNYLRDQISKTVRQLWVQGLNVLMQLFGSGFFIACRGWCSLVHHTNFFFKMVEKWKRYGQNTNSVCFELRSDDRR